MQRRIRNQASHFLDPRHVDLISATPPPFLEAVCGAGPKSLQLGETEPECRVVLQEGRFGGSRGPGGASKCVCSRELMEEGWKSGPSDQFAAPPGETLIIKHKVFREQRQKTENLFLVSVERMDS